MQQGNDAAFRELYQRTAPALLKHARQFLHNEAVCKDLLQDIYVGLYTKRNKLPSNLNVAGYLRTAIKYQVSNALRNELSRGVHHQEILRNSRLTEEHIYRAETKEFQQTIWKKIQALPEKCREAFVLNRFDQQNHQSISRQMGISVKTVEKHISKAIRLLQRELGQKCKQLTCNGGFYILGTLPNSTYLHTDNNLSSSAPRNRIPLIGEPPLLLALLLRFFLHS